jgi:hypothetical protein
MHPAKSDECEAISGRGRAKETIISASLDAEQAIRLANNLVPAAPSKRVLKTWDELSLRSREARLKLGVDQLCAPFSL